MTQGPPPDYEQVDSAVEGVVVYAPRPRDEDGSLTAAVAKCPRCGASVAYDVGAGGLSCPYCDFTQERTAATVGTQADKNAFTLEALQLGEQGFGVERKVLHCDTCAGDVAIEEGAITASCPYCASNHVNVRVQADDQLRPRTLIPFKIHQRDLTERVGEWLGKGWIHPSGLAKLASVDAFEGIYLPFWCFAGRLDCEWEAQVGYERREWYTNSNGSRRQRTVIDWKWENGALRHPIPHQLIPGTSKLSSKLLQRVEDFDLQELEAYTPDVLAGWKACLYDVNLPEAWEEGRARMRNRAKRGCHGQMKGSHVRNFSMTADFEEESWQYVLLPIYVAVYAFRGRSWLVLVNGQTGELDGQKPVAWWKIWLACCLFLTPGAFVVVCLGLPLLLVGIPGLVALFVGFVLTFLGGAGSLQLYRRAVQTEAA